MNDENGTLTNVILRTVFAGLRTWRDKRILQHHPDKWITGRLGPYASSDPIPTRTLDQLGHYQLGHYDKATRTLYQLGPHDYITNSDTTWTKEC